MAAKSKRVKNPNPPGPGVPAGKRVENPNPPPPAVPAGERVKAGSPGSPAALPGDPGAPEKKREPAKKAAPKK